MTVITEVRNAKSLQADNARIDVDILHPDYGWVPYGYNTADTDCTIDNEVILGLIADDFLPYVPPTQAMLDALQAASVRAERNTRLEEVDAVAGNALRWADLDVDAQEAFSAYRQALLDVPQQSGFPNEINWPTLEVSP